jgi:hypothetical protein
MCRIAGMADATVWKTRIEAWQASGLSSTKFCEGKDFTPNALRVQAFRLRRREGDRGKGPDKPVRLVQVVRTPAPAAEPKSPPLTGRAAAPPLQSGQESLLLLEVPGGRIGVAPGFDPQTLASVLEVLEQRSRLPPRSP